MDLRKFKTAHWEIIAVITAFLSTFAGVYTASYISNNQQNNQSLSSYKTLLTVMEQDCLSTMEISNNKESKTTDNSLWEPVAGPNLMLGSLVNNSLLFEHMSADNLSNLVNALEEASGIATKHAVIVGTRNMMPPDYLITSDDGISYLNTLKTKANDYENNYDDSMADLCYIISDIKDRIM